MDWRPRLRFLARIMAGIMRRHSFAQVRMYYHPDIYKAMSADRIFLARDTTIGAIIDGIPQLDCINLYEGVGTAGQL